MKVMNLPNVPDSFFNITGYPKAGNSSDLVVISGQQADDYDVATSACYYLVDHAVSYVIDNDMLSDIGIPEYAHEAVRKTWVEWDKHPYMIGRFDFAGGLDGVPIKMMEFNADTPFSIVETSAIQYGLAKHYGLNPDEKQCNMIYEDLVAYFAVLVEITEERLGRRPSILFSSTDDEEDVANTDILHDACLAAVGNAEKVSYCRWQDVAVDDNGFVCRMSGNRIEGQYDILVKMVPWDLLFVENEDMARAMCSSVEQDKVVVINPVYAAVMQSKALYPVMCGMARDGLIDDDDMPEFLLGTGTVKPESGPYVIKPAYGREGANVTIVGGDGVVEAKTSGFYGDYPMVYQEKAGLNAVDGRNYQAGCFVSVSSGSVRISGLSFRRSESPIITTYSEVCGHIIE